MPIEVELPDGSVVEFPDGTDNATMEVALRSYTASSAQGGNAFANVQRGADTVAIEAAPDPTEGMSRLDRTLVGMGRGASGVYQGIKQLGLQAGEATGLVEPGSAAEYTRNVQDEHDLYDRHAERLGTAGKVGKFAGSALALPIPGAGAGASVAGRLAGAGAMGAVQSGAEFVPEGESRVLNALIGAGTGVGVQGVIGEPLRAGVNKLAALTFGGKANITDKAAQAADYAKTNNLPIYYDDIAGSRGARALGTFTDDLPLLGTGATRKRQAEAAGEAAGYLVDRFDTGSSTRVAETLKDSAENQLARAKGIKNELYKDAFTALNQTGDFDLPKTKALAQRMIAHNQKKGTLADPTLMAELERYANAPTFNFEGWHGARSALGGTIRSKMAGENAVISDASAATLSSLKTQMDSELSQVASKAGGPAANAWKRADAFYKGVIPKYKRGIVADLLKSKNPDAIADKILDGKDSGGVARQVYQALDRGGRAEVRSTLLQRAMEKANVVTADGGEHFSPGIFAKELDRVQNRTAAFFKKEDRLEIDGLKNYMSFVKQSGLYAANPPTGKRALPHLGLLVGSGVLGSKAMAAYGGTALASRLLLRTETGRNLLMRMGSVSPQSKQAAEAAQMINAYLQRGAASEVNEAMEIDIVGGTPISDEQARREYGP